jgi:hypothetical protein
MAISDLRDAVEAADASITETRHQLAIRDTIMKSLEDASTEVRSIACSALGSLVLHFSGDVVAELVGKMAKLGTESPESIVDIYLQGIRTILKGLPSSQAGKISKILIPPMLGALHDSKKSPDHRIGCLFIVTDMLRMPGVDVEQYASSLLDCFLKHLKDPSADVRKEIGIALGMLAPSLDDKQFERLVVNLLAMVKLHKDMDSFGETMFGALTIVRSVCNLSDKTEYGSRYSGTKISAYANDLFPVLLRVLDDTLDSTYELRETSLLV